MIDINFDGLFTIELLHKYFADNLCPDFTITPSGKSGPVINGHKVVVKQYQNKLYAGIQSKAKIPFMPVESGMKMTFYLWLNNPLFINYTNMPAGYDSGDVFYFTNRNNNTVNGKKSLAMLIAAYNNTVSYVPGSLALDGANIVHRAIATNNSGNKHALTDAAFWAPVDNNSYASDNEALQYRPALSTYTFATLQSAAAISVSGYNSGTGAYDLPLFSKNISFTSPVPSFTLDLSSLTQGKYSLTINGEQTWIYINDELNANRPFGVIEIYNEATPVSCNLVNVMTGALLSPLYTINFLNRATVWKYILPNTKTGSVSDASSTYSFAGTSDIISTTPIPLSNQLADFKLTVNGIIINPAPCADPQRLTLLQQGADTYACSEIFINY